MAVAVHLGPCLPPAGQKTPAGNRLPNFLCLHLSTGEAPAPTGREGQMDKLQVRGS